MGRNGAPGLWTKRQVQRSLVELRGATQCPEPPANRLLHPRPQAPQQMKGANLIPLGHPPDPHLLSEEQVSTL